MRVMVIVKATKEPEAESHPLACARPRAGSHSHARTGPSTTPTVTAPDPFVAPYFSFLLERTPKAQPAEPRSWRKDEYPE